MKVKTDTIVRTALLVVALINQILSVMGKPVLPISDDQIERIITLTITIVVSLWSWWKNNDFTKAAMEGSQLMHKLKKNEV